MKVALILSCGLTVPAFAASCEGLTSLHFPDATITTAQMVAAGAFVPPAGGSATAYKRLPEFCRVAVTIKPSSDSDIKAEVWLPGDLEPEVPGGRQRRLGRNDQLRGVGGCRQSGIRNSVHRYRSFH